MPIQYFEGLTSEVDIKQRYKQLAKENHPDRGGCLETMKIINLQYERVITGAYQKAGKSITEIDELLANDQRLREKLYAIIHLDDLVIELCGSWIWVTGDTKTHKETLKANQYYWSNNKCAWYWREPSKRSYNRNPKMSLDLIRYTHGSHRVERTDRVMVG
jgi:hypothetical protein